VELQIVRVDRSKSSEAKDESKPSRTSARVLLIVCAKKNFDTTRFNRKCTVHPQVFNTRAMAAVEQLDTHRQSSVT